MVALNYSQMLRNSGLASGDTIDERNRKAQKDRLFAQQEQRGGLALAREQQAQQQQQQQASIDAEAMAQLPELFKSGNHQGVADMFFKSPDITKRFLESQNIVTEADAKRETDLLTGLVTSTNPREYLKSKIEQLGETQDMSDEIAILESGMTDEQIRNSGLMGIAPLNKDLYENLSSAMQAGKPKPMTEYETQSIGVRQRANDLRSQELKAKDLERKIASEKNQLQREKMEQELSETKRKIEKEKRETNAQKQEDLAVFDTSIETIDRIIESPGFNDAIGVRMPGVSEIPGTDAQFTISQIDTLKSQNFLSQIQKMRGLGALSEAEGKKVADALGSLNVNMSEKDFKKTLGIIKNILNKGKKIMLSRYADDEPQKVKNWSDL